MNIKHYENGFPCIIIEDYYNEEEKALIWKELDFFLPSLKSPDHTGSAVDSVTNETLKRNKGLYLDSIFNDRDVSNILKVNRKLFHMLEEEKDNIGYNNWFFKNQNTHSDTTLVSYYETSDYYKPHKDESLFTSLTWFYKEPKSFTGGDFNFPDYNITIECQHNMTVIFPSMIRHSVDSVSVDDDKLDQGYGRWSITQFGSYHSVTV